MKKILYLLLVALICSAETVFTAHAEIPLVGGQVIIEPGQTDADIRLYFQRLSENGMKVCRVRMFENYMRRPDGAWDFSLFDKVFEVAGKYDVKIFATLFPATNSIGGFKFPDSKEHEIRIATYIHKLVEHYKDFKSLYGWVLINEPGTGGWVPETAYTRQKFEEWRQKQKKICPIDGDYPLLVDFWKERFLCDYTVWYLGWLAGEIEKYDKKHEIHVNNHQIFDNVAEYDFPAWRNFLTSLGASAHPSWHFGFFDRSQYALALSANCNIIRSGAGNLPFWVTELQGGNNTYSGKTAFCPTKEEITQWLWTAIGEGAQGIIFWSLNARSTGEEAGEWALLDFLNNPSDRMQAASDVTKCLSANKNLFAGAAPFDASINILYSRESLWTEKKVQFGDYSDMRYEGRLPGGVMKSVLSCYEVLSENGIKSNIKEIREFDWTKNNYTEQVIILANQICISSEHWDKIRNFVAKGGKLLVEGLTAFYDENMHCIANKHFPLQDVFGGVFREVKCIPGNFEMQIVNLLPVHLWKGFIYNTTGEVLANEENMITAVTNSFGKGNVIWIPSLIGLGAWQTKNKEPLSGLLKENLAAQIHHQPFCFSNRYDRLKMEILETKNSYITVLINKGDRVENVNMIVNIDSKLTPYVIFGDKNCLLSPASVMISPEETIVINWNKN